MLKNNINKASRMMKLMGWVVFFMCLFMSLAFIIPSLEDESYDLGSQDTLIMVASLVVLLVSSMFIFRVAYLLEKSVSKWIKFSAYLISILFLFFFPIGTILGLSTLYYLVKGNDQMGGI